MENIKWKAVELSTPQYPDGAIIIKEDTEIEYPLAIVPFPGRHENGTKMQRKRAKLIAAAPELLDLLKRFVEASANSPALFKFEDNVIVLIMPCVGNGSNIELKTKIITK